MYDYDTLVTFIVVKLYKMMHIFIGPLPGATTNLHSLPINYVPWCLAYKAVNFMIGKHLHFQNKNIMGKKLYSKCNKPYAQHNSFSDQKLFCPIDFAATNHQSMCLNAQ